MGHRLPLLAIVALALAGCSGTPFGDQLARSFSAPQPPSAKPSQPPAAKPSQAPAAKPDAPPRAPQPRPAPAGQPSKPAPYRITIQLPAADPAAPAEVVTEALRAAGVRFEVEMIERIGAAPAAGAPAAPTVTPAPAPR